MRNIGIIAHIDAGKTTTTERVLYYTGEIHRMGDVDKGNTTTDYLEEERERGITIVAAAITCHWKDAEGQPITINIIDTPGHVDFTAEVERSLRVLDGAVVVFSAVEGVEAQSETVWRQAAKYRVPRICFINKMDRIGAEFERVYQEIEERLLESHPIPVQIPIGAGPEGTMGEFQGLIDLIAMKALFYKTEDLGSTITETEIPESVRAEAELWREKMLNALSDKDETFTEAYMAHLEGAELPTDQIVAALRRATLTGQVHPVLCGSSLRYVGVQRLLDAVAAYLPSPLDKPPVVGHHPKKGTEMTRKPSPDEPFCGLVFKITNDAHGDLSFVRIYSGRLKSGTRVYNPGKDKKEVCSRLYHIRADDREQIQEAIAGDIVGIVGLKDSVTGDTLCDAAAPDPAGADRVPRDGHQHVDRAGQLGRQGEAGGDPERARARGPDLLLPGQRGDRPDPDLGHGRAAHGDPQEPDDPRLPAEGARGPAAGQLSRDDQEGGEARRGDLHPPDGRLGAVCQGHDRPGAGDPAQGGAGAPLRQQAQGRRDPGRVPAGDRGRPARGGQVRRPDRLSARRPEGHAGRRRRPTTSTPTTWRSASPPRTPCARPSRRPAPCCWSRSCSVEIVTPEDYLGSITADLSSRRALIDHTSTRGKLMVIDARAPLEQMFGYSTAVRSLSQGRAGYTMEPLEYAAAPDSLLEAIAGM